MKLNRIYTKLWLMMFLQFMQFAVWWVPLAAYLTNLGVGDMQKALILSSMAIGCIVSPIVGGLADRYFSGEKILAGLNLLTALLLVFAGFQSNPDILFVLLLLAMFTYMPQLGIDQRNSDDPLALGTVSANPPCWFGRMGSFRSV